MFQNLKEYLVIDKIWQSTFNSSQGHQRLEYQCLKAKTKIVVNKIATSVDGSAFVNFR